MMNKDLPGNCNTLNPRRTGLDRRWIPSANHQPERRRSSDRRTIRNRSFLEPLELSGAAENRELFPEIKLQTGTPESKNTAMPVDEKGFSAHRESVSNGERQTAGDLRMKPNS